MKHYLIEISAGDEKIAGKGIYEYENSRMATAAYHTKLGTAMKSELYTSEMLMVINEDGDTLEKTHYIAEEAAE